MRVLPNAFFKFILLLDAMALRQKTTVDSFRIRKAVMIMSASTSQYSQEGIVLKIERNMKAVGAVSGK